MEKTMRVAVMTGLNKIEFEDRPIPAPTEDEALIKIEYVGICGSDLHFYEKGAIGEHIITSPFVLGHEASGTVVQVGSRVTHLKPGDRVALEPGITCGECEFCRKGEYNLCPDVRFFAVPPIDGVFEEYVAHEAKLCFKLPDNVSCLEGALVEPLAVGLHACVRGNAGIGQTAVVFGTGCIGLVSLLALKAMGVAKVIVADVLENRLAKAADIGADHVINSKNEDLKAKIGELTNGEGVDLIIDTAGADITIRQGVEIIKKGGMIVYVGYTKGETAPYPLNLALDKEITMKTIYRYRHLYPVAIKAIAQGNIDVKSIVTDMFKFEDMQNALDSSVSQKDKIVKAVIEIG